MATAFKMAYAGPDTAVTITLANLASSATAGRESTVVSNTTNLDLDVQLAVVGQFTGGANANDKGAYIFVYGTVGGTSYPDNLTGADAAATPVSENNLTLLGFLNLVTVDVRHMRFLGSLATVFGSMPEKWGVFYRNYCGRSLTNTGSLQSVTYNRLQTQGV